MTKGRTKKECDCETLAGMKAHTMECVFGKTPHTNKTTGCCGECIYFTHPNKDDDKGPFCSNKKCPCHTNTSLREFREKFVRDDGLLDSKYPEDIEQFITSVLAVECAIAERRGAEEATKAAADIWAQDVESAYKKGFVDGSLLGGTTKEDVAEK